MQSLFLEIKRRKKLYLSYKRQVGTAPVQTNAITTGSTTTRASYVIITVTIVHTVLVWI